MMSEHPEEILDPSQKSSLKERLNHRQVNDFSSATLRRLALTRLGRQRPH